MTDLVRSLTAWVGLLTKPRGKHRDSVLCPRPAPNTRPPTLDTPLPAHRSPYGVDTPLDGTATVAVRPYVTAHEQRQRRHELAMAALGLEMPGPYWVHGMEVA